MLGASFDPVDMVGLPPAEKHSLQGERLAALVARLASSGNAFWKDRLSAVADRVARVLADRIRIRADLDLVPAGSMPRTEVGKVQRVFEQVDDVDPLA